MTPLAKKFLTITTLTTAALVPFTTHLGLIEFAVLFLAVVAASYLAALLGTLALYRVRDTRRARRRAGRGVVVSFRAPQGGRAA